MVGSDIILANLNNIFRDVFDDDNIVLTRSTRADDLDDWDSLQQVNIILAAQQQFNIKLNVRKTFSFDDVGQLVDYIEEKLNSSE